MKFEKRNFMGIELDVLVGHPEHDLLFVATQVARAVGLSNPSAVVSNYKRGYTSLTVQLKDIVETCSETVGVPNGPNGKAYHPATNLMPEADLYQLLLRGHAPQSEPFRKWVTEEVLPSIRKTGKYNAEESTNPIALAIMDELKSLRGEIVSLRQELQAKTFSLEAPAAAEVSPYEGQRVARQ